MDASGSATAASGSLFRWTELDVLEPAIGAVVLQADIAPMRMGFVGHVELMFRTVGSFVRLGELIQVEGVHLLPIQNHADHAPGTGHFDMVPLPGGFHRIF